MTTTTKEPPGPAPTPRPGLGTQLDTLRAGLATLDGLDLLSLPSPELLHAVTQVEVLTRQLDSLTARVLAAAETDGMWATTGARSFAAWYRNTTGRHRTTATRTVRQARLLRDQLPTTAAALQAGTISTDHVAAMTRHTTNTPDRRTQLSDPDLGEHFLIREATTMDASDFDKLVRHWATRTDPEAADRNWVNESEREELTLARTTDGYHLQGWLSTINGQALETALNARTGTPSKDDTRGPAQRRAHSLNSIVRLILDSGVLRPGARIRPHLTVTVTYDTLQRLTAATHPHRTRTRCTTTGAPALVSPPATGEEPEAPTPPRASTEPPHRWVIPTDLDYDLLTGADPATLADGTPIPPQLLARLTCQSQLARTIFGPASQILDSGREERLFTPAQTRAIIARDTRCRYPGCDAPPGEGEIHHSLWWNEHHGTTTAPLGILLCWYHHDYVHQRTITIHRTGDHWTFTRNNGTTIT